MRCDFGHNLEVVLQFGRDNGLTGLTEQQVHLVGRVGYWYKQKLLEYPMIQGYSIPKLRPVRELLNQLIRSVYVAIWDEPDYLYRRDKRKNPGMRIDAEYEG